MSYSKVWAHDQRLGGDLNMLYFMILRLTPQFSVTERTPEIAAQSGADLKNVTKKQPREVLRRSWTSWMMMSPTT